MLLRDLFNLKKDNYRHDRFGMPCNNRCNQTGFKYVSRVNHKVYRQGFCWRYRRELGGEVVQVQGVNLMILMERVINRGLPWEVTDENRAMSSVVDDGFSWDVFEANMKNKGLSWNGAG